MEMIFWIITISVVCIITGVIFYRPYLGIALVIISIPFEGKIDFDSFTVYPLETIMGILICICLYKLIVCRENYFRNTKLVYCYLPFMLCILLSTLKSMEYSLSVKEVVRWLELILIYFLTINLINDDKKLIVILYTMILATVMVSVYGVVSYLVGVESAYGGRSEVFSFFGNTNPLAGYVNLIIPVVFGMLLVSILLWKRIALGIFTILSIVAWFLTFSKTAWLSLVLTVILIFFLTKVKRKVALLLVTLFTVFTITFLSSNIKDDLTGRLRLHTIRGTVEERFGFYPLGFNMVKNDLIFGIGIGNYHLLIDNFIQKNAVLMQNDLRSVLVNTHLHSLYLQIFVETGIMGMSAFAFWLVCVIKYLVSSLRSLERSRDYGLLVGLVGGVIVYLFNNLTDILVVHGIHLQWDIILGLAMVLIQFRESEKCPEMV